MWNRVLLLASGMAFGWTLVGCWTASLERVGELRVRLALSLVLGGVVVWLMAVGSPQAGLAGVAVLLVSALVAYAANARQVSRMPRPSPLGRPALPLEKNGRIAVLLITEGEPAEYDGPAPWARRYQQVRARGETIPHWFVRPLVYARIRAAYRAMGGRSPLASWAAHLAQQLQARLGPEYRVNEADQDTNTGAYRLLAHLAEEGISRVILLPIDLAGDPREALHEQVGLSRVREIGVDIAYTQPLESSFWSPAHDDERFHRLAQGLTVAAPPEVDPQVLEEMANRVRDSAGKWAAPGRFVPRLQDV